MSEKILEAFRKERRLNVFELMLRLGVDRDPLEQTLNTLVNHDKLRVAEIRLSRPDDSSAYKGLRSRSSIRGFCGATYVFNE